MTFTLLGAGGWGANWTNLFLRRVSIHWRTTPEAWRWHSQSASPPRRGVRLKWLSLRPGTGFHSDETEVLIW